MFSCLKNEIKYKRIVFVFIDMWQFMAKYLVISTDFLLTIFSYSNIDYRSLSMNTDIGQFSRWIIKRIDFVLKNIGRNAYFTSQWESE